MILNKKLMIFDQYFPLNQSHLIQLATYILFAQQFFPVIFFGLTNILEAVYSELLWEESDCYF